jgi:alpha-pyrone synthase
LTRAYINAIATAVPPYDVHEAFVQFGGGLLAHDPRKLTLFQRLAERAEIDHRYSYISPQSPPPGAGVPGAEFYKRGDFPSTAARMRVFETYAPALAQAAIDKLELGADAKTLSHLIITSCTGFSAPGLDFEIIAQNGLSGSIERSMIGFMGCYAAMNALKLARHIVRSEAHARVLVLNLELCSLHLQETDDLEDVLSFLIFSDGCAASVISAEPAGLEMESFRAVLIPDTRELIQWNVGEKGFEMVLSGQVPASIQTGLRTHAPEILAGAPIPSIDLWAVHPGGRTVLDAVERGLGLEPVQLAASRDILRRFGNMSSATIMFVLERLLRGPMGGRGCAMSFGPGLVAETMLFAKG